MGCIVVQIKMTGFKYKNSDSFVAPSSEFKRNEGHFQMLNNWISIKSKKHNFFTNLDMNQYG